MQSEATKSWNEFGLEVGRLLSEQTEARQFQQETARCTLALLAEIGLRVDTLEGIVEEPRYVRNCDSEVIHRPGVYHRSLPPLLWKSSCGWKFGTQNFAWEMKLPCGGSRICEKCLPDLKLLSTTESSDEDTRG